MQVRAAAIAVEAGTAASRRVAELLDLIERKKKLIGESFYEIGLALREIKKKKLYASLGYKSFVALLDDRDVLGHTQASKLIEIVDAMTRDQALALGGVEKAYAAARLVAETTEPDTIGSLLTSGVKTGSHGRGRKHLTSMTARDIAAQASAERKRTHEKSDAERAADAGAKLARATLRAAGFRVVECKAVHHAKEWRVHVIAAPPGRSSH